MKSKAEIKELIIFNTKDIKKCKAKGCLKEAKFLICFNNKEVYLCLRCKRVLIGNLFYSDKKESTQKEIYNFSKKTKHNLTEIHKIIKR